MRTIASCMGCRRGGTAVEFALVAPMLLMTIVFVMTTGLELFINQGLDYATAQAARGIMTGADQGSSMSQSTLTSAICSKLPVVINCADLIVNLYIVPRSNFPGGYYTFVKSDYSGLILPALTPGSGQFSMGIQGDYQYLQVIYPITLLPPFMANLFGGTQYKGSAAYLAISSAVFRNEKY